MPEPQAESARWPWVRGHCPSCHTANVFVGADGYLTCANLDCARPEAPSEALGVTFPEPVTSPAQSQDGAR